MSFHFVQTRVEIASVGATWPAADVLLLPTNDYLWMASGSALDVKKAAGEGVEIAAVRQGPIALGDVVPTDAGSLPFAAILHAAIMGQDLHPAPDAVDRAVRKGFAIAGEKRWKRIILHSFLTAGRRSGPEAVRAAIGAVVDVLLDGSTLHEVTFLASDEQERTILHDALLRTIQKHG